MTARRNHALGPAGIPETRFHFKTEVLRFGRVGNTCTGFCAHYSTSPAQHKRRVFITFRGHEGQSHGSEVSFSAVLPLFFALSRALIPAADATSGSQAYRKRLPDLMAALRKKHGISRDYGWRSQSTHPPPEAEQMELFA